MSIRRSDCTNGVVRSRGKGYEKCSEKINESSLAEVFEKVGWSETNRNEEVSRKAGIERELASKADQRALRWFGHVERMDEYRMARRM